MSKLTKISTISYKAIFSQRDNIYLAVFKYDITYQSIREKRADRFLYPEMLEMAKKLPNNSHGWAFYKMSKFILTKKVY